MVTVSRSATCRVGSAILAAFLISCGGPSGDVDAFTAIQVLPGDVHLLGTEESLAVIRDLEVLPDGSVWILNSLAPFFVGFDSSGEMIAVHGAEGGGPEEYRLPAGFVTGGWGGEAWVFDLGHHALIRVSKPDEDWAEIPLPRTALPPGTTRGGMDMLSPIVRTARLGDVVVLPHSTGTLESGVFSLIASILKAELVRLDPATGAVGRIVRLGETLDDPFVGFEATEGGFPLWRRLWAVCGDHLRIYDRVRNELRGFGVSGAELDPVQLPSMDLSDVTPREFAGAVFGLRQAEVTGGVANRLSPDDSIRILNSMANSVNGNPAQLAGYLPRYVDFRCSDAGTMWLRPLDLEVGGLAGGPDWLRVALDGRSRLVSFPERFDALRFTEDRAWGVQRDEFDVASIAWAELPKD